MKKLLVLIVLVCLVSCKPLKHRSDGSVKFADFHLNEDAPLDEHDGCVLRLTPEPVEVPESQSRNLQETNSIRNMRILTYFPDETDLNIDLEALERNYEIAAHYYETIFKVRPYANRLSTRGGSTCGQIAIPDEIIQNGFDVETVDTVILTRVYSEPDTSIRTLAFAGPCRILRAPIISQINYRVELINNYLSSSNYQWHQLVVITMHEMGHIFGVIGGVYDNVWSQDGELRSYLYESPDSNTRIRKDKIIATNVQGDSGREYMILPAVKQYADSIFQCDQTVTGAKMQEGASHWDLTVWDRELMVPSIGSLDNRISPLTAGLYLGTGWYAEVEVFFTWDLARGLQQGCSFMKGQNTSFGAPIACDASRSASQCDLYSNFGGTCQSTGRVSRSRTCQINSPETRCFETSSNTACVEAICTGKDPITVTLYNGNSQQTCVEGGDATVILNGVEYSCPDNYKIFCDHETCDNWCSTNGVCINGVCNYEENTCRNSVEGCEFCSSTNRGSIGCDQCLVTLELTDGACVSSNCQIENCGLCSIDSNDQQVCVSCILGSPSVDRKSCENVETCPNDIPNCDGCDQTTNECNSCAAPWVLGTTNPPTCVVPQCQTVVIGCSSCSIDNSNNFICDACSGDRILIAGQCSFIDCGQKFSNCALCTEDGDTLSCSSCNSPYTLNEETGLCQILCDIQNCQTCSIETREGVDVKVCDECKGDWKLSEGSESCQAPDTETCLDIANCETCAFSNDDLTCTDCVGDWKLADDSESCNQPNTETCEDIGNCETCSFETNDLTCGSCVGDWELAEDGQSCDRPNTETCEGIDNCQSCTFANNNLTCTDCVGDWNLAEDGQSCIQPNTQTCQDIGNCQTCTFSNNNLTCDSCVGDWELADDFETCNQPDTQTCQAITKCQTCTFTNNNLTCTQCVGDWNLAEDSQSCVSPNTETCEGIDNCNTCTFENDDLICDSCDQGFTRSEDGEICQPDEVDPCTEVQNCDTCSVNNNGVATCSECSPGFAKNGGECFACPEDCARCRARRVEGQVQTTCQECQEDFLRYNGKCYECAFDNCATCKIVESEGQVGTECRTCDQGFALFEGSCYECALDDCDICRLRDSDEDGTPETFCQRCDPDYAKFEQGCQLCVIQNCSDCRVRRDNAGEVITFCRTCDEGFARVENGCEALA